MVAVRSDWTPIHTAIAHGTQEAARELESAMRPTLPHLTGRYAGATTVVATEVPGGWDLDVLNPLPQRDALEVGYNAGPRVGPHMRGQHAIKHAVETLEGPILDRALATARA